jgi:hypothetical protein
MPANQKKSSKGSVGQVQQGMRVDFFAVATYRRAEEGYDFERQRDRAGFEVDGVAVSNQ